MRTRVLNHVARQRVRKLVHARHFMHRRVVVIHPRHHVPVSFDPKSQRSAENKRTEMWKKCGSEDRVHLFTFFFVFNSLPPSAFFSLPHDDLDAEEYLEPGALKVMLLICGNLHQYSA